MAPRPGIARPRDIDFSAVGKAGRRTGVTLPLQKLDGYGLEEVSNLFSSPRKPSPLKNVTNAEPFGLTPRPAPSTRANTRASLPRSASPRKSGISGTARRTNRVDIRAISREPEILNSEDPDPENAAASSPSRAHHSAKRHAKSLEKTPLRDITDDNTLSSREKITWDKLIEDEVATVEDEDQHPAREPSLEITRGGSHHFEDDGPVIGNDDGYDDHHERGFTPAEEPPATFDDEEADETFEPEPAFPRQNKANSWRKRRSDLEVPTSPPPQKRLRRESPSQTRNSTEPPEAMPPAESSRNAAKTKLAPKQRERPALKAKTTNSQMSARQQKELDEVVERVRARPNPPKSLYIFRRETPADDGITHTRSGRLSFKPLAYWRNEQCVYGGSPSGAGLKDGARFPLNSIKEIIRTEEVAVPMPSRKGKKGKGKAAKSRPQTAELEGSESDNEIDYHDPEAEPWETEVGTIQGRVSVWDAQAQAPIDEEEEIDIAYGPAAIETSVVKAGSSQGPSFKYAKLLGNKFMGVGLVDLEPGGIKRPKNSRKMHMSFFVVRGRVTVNVGPAGGDEAGSWTEFSIGKGGFWQVPRGNQYSIENVLDKPARIFFSQGCEVSVDEDEG